MDRVYIETSVIGYLTARMSRDIVVAARQQLTREWWDAGREFFELVTSQVVLDEIQSGDPDAVRDRLATVTDIPILEATDLSEQLTLQLLDPGPLPAFAVADAAHIAIAASHGANFLVQNILEQRFDHSCYPNYLFSELKSL